MSNQAITWALDTPTAGPATKVLLIALANYANESNVSYPSIERLARETDQSPASVKRHLNDLVKAGLVTRVKRGSEAGGRLTNSYTLAIPARVKAQIEPEGLGLNPGGVRDHSEGGLGLTVEPLTIFNPSEPSLVKGRQDVERVCLILADAIEANGSKRPSITENWRKDARLLMDKDHRSEAQVTRMIAWCQADDFWRANILSMKKLREKYDQMRLKAEAEIKAQPAVRAVPSYAELPVPDRDSLPWAAGK